LPGEYFQILDAGTQTYDVRIRTEQIASADLILGVVDQGTTFEFPDLYTITINDVDIANDLIDISVAGGTLHNPFVVSNKEDVVADGTTYNYDIIPGIGVQFYEADSLSIGDAAYLHIGYDLTDGTLSAGDSDDSTESKARFALKNVHTGTLSNCKVRVLPKPRPSNTSGEAIIAAVCNELWAYSTTQEFQITFTGFTPGSNQVCQVDGGGDITITCDATTYDEIVTGLTVQFDEAASISASDTAIIRVSDGYRYVELATDDDGLPDTWISGTSVQVVESGQINGMITSNGVGFFWKRLVVDSSVTPSDNPREYVLLAQGDITS
jgi:hypothetical protein